MAILKRQRGAMITAREMVNTLKNEGVVAELVGPESLVPTHVAAIDKADNKSLTFYIGMDPEPVKSVRHSVLFCKLELTGVHESVSRIIVDDPRLAFTIIAQEFLPPLPGVGIHLTAIVDPKAEIHPTAYIGPYSTLERCSVGEGSVIHPRVMIYGNTTIGRRVEIEAGAVIGATGLGRSVGPDGRHWLFPHFGETVLEDETFVGANSVITRGVLGRTMLKEGSRINASVVIAHNCIIGRHTAVSIGATISGSSVVGERCFIGSSASLKEGIKLGNDIVVGMGAVVTKSFEEDNIVIMGNPARVYKERRS
jgi:UDP-3-O-[3-hydroxymyristoyl] glucosamine N-acyltransferase